MDIWEERTARTAFAFESVSTAGTGSGGSSLVQEHPVGMVGYYWVEHGETPLAHLVSLWVHPSHRSKGLGTGLVEWVVEQVLPPGKDNSGRRLQLQVDQRNKAVTSMYERLGFRSLDDDDGSMEYAPGEQ